MAYVFGGVYVPLSCKLVEAALLKGTFSNDEITKHLPGDNFSKCKTGSVKVSTLKKNRSGDPGAQIALVYFIGGNWSGPVFLSVLTYISRSNVFRNRRAAVLGEAKQLLLYICHNCNSKWRTFTKLIHC